MQLEGRLLEIATTGGGLPPDKVAKYRAKFEAQGFELPAYTGEQPLPSLLKQAANLAKATTKHVRAGRPKASKAEVARRLAICERNECGFFRASDRRCAHQACGCFLKTKVTWLTEGCPVGLWEASKIDNGVWAVGITTAPRKDPTLAKCVQSLLANNWAPTIFAEPKSPQLDLVQGCPVVERPHKFGAWRNWLTMVEQLLADYPKATRILTVQDDTVLVPGSRALLDETGWPAADCAFVSLYTPKHYASRWQLFDGEGRLVYDLANLDKAHGLRDKHGYTLKTVPKAPGIIHVVTDSLWGACALAFPRKFLEQLVQHRIARNWKGARKKNKPMPRNPADWRNVDTAIGKVANACKRRMFFVNPSCASHVAQHSTLGHGGNDGKRNAARVAVDPLVDCKRTYDIDFISYARLARDCERFAQELPREKIRAVCGIPRSGLLPATMLACQLHRPMIDFGELLAGGRNSSRPSISRKLDVDCDGDARILLVDDSVVHAKTFREVLPKLAHVGPLYTAAVYTSPAGRSKVDFAFAEVPQGRHFMQWNCLQNHLNAHCLVDLDGVICDDWHGNEDTEPERYERHVLQARPLLRPKIKLLGIVTSRRERWRRETEAWLARHQVPYGQLIMEPGEPRRFAKYKAEIYRRHTEAELFIESDQRTAEAIHELTGRPVLSVERWELIGGRR